MHWWNRDPAVVVDVSEEQTIGARRGTRATPVPTFRLALTLGALAALAILAVIFAWLAWTRLPGDDSVEAGFARDMSVHHEQAVEMALLVRDQTQDPDIKTLATDIVLTQVGQMGQMAGWLSVWDLPQTGRDAPMAWMEHPAGGTMPGIASPEEIAQLSRLAGEAADREFLRLMIRHHEGAVPMAQAALERSGNEVVRTLAESIITSQMIEIQTMQSMLERKGGSVGGAG